MFWIFYEVKGELNRKGFLIIEDWLVVIILSTELKEVIFVCPSLCSTALQVHVIKMIYQKEKKIY